MLERTESKYTVEATSGNFVRVTVTMVGDWVEIPAPLIGERLLQYIHDHKNHQQIVTLKKDLIKLLTGKIQYNWSSTTTRGSDFQLPTLMRRKTTRTRREVKWLRRAPNSQPNARNTYKILRGYNR